MIDFAGFDARARLISERLHLPAEAVPEACHTIINDFCDRWFPLPADDEALSSPRERMLAYEMLWRFLLESAEHSFGIAGLPQQRHGEP